MAFTGSNTINSGSVIKSTHIQEMRDNLDIIDNTCITHYGTVYNTQYTGHDGTQYTTNDGSYNSDVDSSDYGTVCSGENSGENLSDNTNADNSLNSTVDSAAQNSDDSNDDGNHDYTNDASINDGNNVSHYGSRHSGYNGTENVAHETGYNTDAESTY